MNALRKWMNDATADEQEKLAKKAGTTRNYLLQVAGGHRDMSADLAGRIESATTAMHAKTKLPILTRDKLATACSVCPYAKQCLAHKKDKAK